jgi:nucleoid-associated protein YgaU
MNRKVAVLFAGFFLLSWIGCSFLVLQNSRKFSPVCKTAWTVRVVKMVEHVVKKGDNITKIAKKYGVSIEEILKANSMDDFNTIEVGEKIKIPLKTINGDILI